MILANSGSTTRIFTLGKNTVSPRRGADANIFNFLEQKRGSVKKKPPIIWEVGICADSGQLRLVWTVELCLGYSGRGGVHIFKTHVWSTAFDIRLAMRRTYTLR